MGIDKRVICSNPLQNTPGTVCLLQGPFGRAVRGRIIMALGHKDLKVQVEPTCNTGQKKVEV